MSRDISIMLVAEMNIVGPPYLAIQPRKAKPVLAIGDVLVTKHPFYAEYISKENHSNSQSQVYLADAG